MKTIIILLTIITSQYINAKTFLGIAQGVHLQGEKLNDTHPYLGVNLYNFGAMTYLNSFNKVGFAGYYEFKEKKSKSIEFNFKIGVTTGYSPIMDYEGHTYRLGKKFFFDNNIMLLMIPGMSFKYNDYSLDFTLLGDSLNAGITIRF